MPYRVLVTATQDSIDRVLESGCDGAVIDLADASFDVEASRRWFLTALPTLRGAGLKVLARVNHPRTMLLRDDLDVIVRPGLDALILPHVTEAQAVRDLGVLLREFELPRDMEPGNVKVFPTIDSARGVQRAGELAAVAPRVGGLVFDAEGYASDVGARPEESGPRLAFARGTCVAAARAADGLPLVAGEGTDSRTLSQYGFAGVWLTSTSQVHTARSVFTPSANDIAKAKEIVAAYEAARAQGAAVARLGRAVVDGSDMRRAKQLLDGVSESDGS